MSLLHPFRHRTDPAFLTPADFGYVELRGATTRVVVVPALGGKITDLTIGGRQWLWTSNVIPYAPGVPGASYVETGDSGGFDECFPTVGACRVPGWVRGFGGMELPDHGDLWCRVPETVIRTTAEGQIAECTWVGERLKYRFVRTLRVDRLGGVHFEYEVRNEGSDRLPFIWSAHPLFPLTERTRILLPEGARLRYYARHGIELGEPRSEHRWPWVRFGQRPLDFVNPWEVGKKYACKLFVDMPDGLAVLRELNHELRITFDPTKITHVGVWVNKHGWTPFRDQLPYQNLSLEPAVGAPDTLSDALGEWKSAAWVDAGSSRRWSMKLTGGAIGGGEA